MSQKKGEILFFYIQNFQTFGRQKEEDTIFCIFHFFIFVLETEAKKKHASKMERNEIKKKQKNKMKRNEKEKTRKKMKRNASKRDERHGRHRPTEVLESENISLRP